MEMNLFEPITIRGMQLKNRIVMSPMSLGIGIGGQGRAFYVERAKGGVWSGGMTPFGYAADSKAKTLKVVPSEAKIVMAIFDEFLNHKSVRRTILSINAARAFHA